MADGSIAFSTPYPNLILFGRTDDLTCSIRVRREGERNVFGIDF